MSQKKVFIETYGCQMNFSDSEIVGSIMKSIDYQLTTEIKEANVIFLNTCSIRDNAEQRVNRRLRELRSYKKNNPDLKIGLLGCMAERLKEQIFNEEAVDLIVGPDAYRDLPNLLNTVDSGQKAANVILSEEETYAEIEPVRLDNNGISAFISIMRGCENFCTYCVVPYTRGKERSRSPETIINEAKDLFQKGYREITLLGQNVNSYQWEDDKSFNFTKLLESIALINPLLRVRFATSHPKDISDELLHIIAKYENICKAIHLPVQSGSSEVLKKMNRKYTREWYMNRIEAIKTIIPDCAVSTDIIAGFCGETDENHQDTLSLMQMVGFDYAFMFKYSERPDTVAAKRFKDDVPDHIKSKRLEEIIELQKHLSLASNKNDIGKTFKVLADSISKRSKLKLSGRNSQNKVVVFPKEDYNIADYVNIKITDCTSATLIGEAVLIS
ncbi:MAG: tRNA (N6-isopentenyl adenosine(37)-C2)-methylthiotransferase MiaB [Bacteroidetes bacterium]|nr:tRNA (N6-isopentenyl adenosine(37)-C2)-methylthiotransferase MiaB [Bacteroidota bacterium]